GMNQIMKTYTCEKCGKVGQTFEGMAQEKCPADVNANHCIPIFGDSVKADKPEIVRQTPRMTQEQIDEMNRKYEEREKLKAQPVKVGDIFERSWGYEQTNVDFYKVLELTPSGKSAKVIKIGQKIERATGFMSETVVADPDNVVGKEIHTWRIKQYREGGPVYIGETWRWDGEPCHQSHYA
ncbi:MAG: hypothetical protein KGI27_15505, partial [Thaumarchaeota archaeon]|nr:hypothetical protein [Nitrososphaerota archaeon]